VLWAQWRRIGALKRRRFTQEFKLQVLREIEAGKSIAQAAREHQLHPNLITRWRGLHAQYASEAFAGNGNHYKQEARIAELERMAGRLSLENDFLKKAFRFWNRSTKRTTSKSNDHRSY
jgi:transposase